MKVTFILKNLTDTFFEGNGASIVGLNNMGVRERFDYLARKCRDLQITMKIGTGQFRDQVELNQMLRGEVAIEYKIDPRRGYKLATFELRKA